MTDNVNRLMAIRQVEEMASREGWPKPEWTEIDWNDGINAIVALSPDLRLYGIGYKL